MSYEMFSFLQVKSFRMACMDVIVRRHVDWHKQNS